MRATCYSPSLVIKDFFAVGQSYPLPDFLRRSREALTIAVPDRAWRCFGGALQDLDQKSRKQLHAK